LEAAFGKRERMLGRLPFHGTAISKSADGIVLGGGSVRPNSDTGESFMMSFRDTVPQGSLGLERRTVCLGPRKGRRTAARK
jgi:hypothetical protein